MREKWQKQMPLMSHILDHSQSKKLEVISGTIDANPTICEYILQDLNRGKSETYRAGAKGMSAEQVLRCTVVKNLYFQALNRNQSHCYNTECCCN